MLRIRLSRTGKKNFPHYALVVTEKTNPASDGNFVEKLGTYSPLGETPELNYDKDRVMHWVSVGARPTETLARLLVKDGIKEMEKFYDTKKKYDKKSKKAQEDAPAEEGGGAAPATEEGGAEAPAAEEKPAEEPAKEEVPAEEPKAEEKPAEEPAKEEAPAEETKKEEDAAEEEPKSEA